MSPAQARRRLLTRYAVKLTDGATPTAMRARALLSELAAEIDAGHRETLIEILANSDRNALMPIGGPREALFSVAARCRAELENLEAMQLMGNAASESELPPHILPHPAPPEEPLALRVSLPGAMTMTSTFWLDSFTAEDLEAMASWIRARKAKTI